MGHSGIPTPWAGTDVAVTLLTPTTIRRICTELHIQPTKTLGQNFVHDASTVRRIVTAAAITPGTHVLEVGPGLGSLTLGLLEAGARVTAVEIDPVLATALPATVAGHAGTHAPLRVLRADAISVRNLDDLTRAISVTEAVATTSEDADAAREASASADWGSPTAMVANLPYNVAVPLIMNVLEHFPTIRDILVMVQTEVAQRLSAQPGSRIYGVPSVKVRWYGRASMAGNISRQVFWPVPHVDSSLVRITRYGAGDDIPAVHDVEREALFTVIDQAFSQRRKGLRAALKTWAGGAAQSEAILNDAGIDPTRRGETCTIEDFAAIARAAQVRARQRRGE